ncbi:MAG: phage Gp37/Gp68 family protein [Gemmatimonadetes bacterium]|nr:phage Gp37/Gp68 family protein [Gemmatimonadota bacterium]
MTKIEWSEVTWNPVTGCDMISPGCDNCYAMTLAARLKAMGNRRYQSDGDPLTSGPGFGVTIHEDKITEPMRWKRPRTVFVNSMSDLFHERIPDDVILRIHQTMIDCPQHTFQILTKRVHRLETVPIHWRANEWIGVSVENQKYVFRARRLVHNVIADVKFLSVEPLLGPVSLPSDILAGIDWCIVGGESGPGHRPVNPDWVRHLRDQCIAAAVPFFFKQWGGRTPKAGGRELDGQIWDEMPSTERTPT